MSEGLGAGTSIRRRLLFSLISALLLLVAGAAGVTYWVALRAANDAYDRALLDPTVDLAQNIHYQDGRPTLDLPQKALETLLYDQVDKIIFQVRAPDGTVIAGVPELAAPPELAPGRYAFLDVSYSGEPFRIAALHAAGGATVQVGETTQKRNRLIWEIMGAEIALTLLIAVAAVGLAWVGVAHGLGRLSRVRSELLRRSAHDLHPIDATNAPEEIAPLVDAFNRLLAQLGEANAMQQRFLANAAHQLRTPLAGLQMHLELLLRRELTPELRTEISRLLSATVRASRLATQLLALAKAESTRRRPDGIEPVDLYAVADAAAREWAPQAAARNIDLGFILEPAVLPGDPLLLRELMNNLVDNALRYTPPGGAVTVKTGHEDGTPFISVDDTGPGIPDAERSKVVERFYRMAGTPGEGSGLGLAIVKEVVDRHGGKLDIGTRDGGCGTRVRVSFPADAVAPVH